MANFLSDSQVFGANNVPMTNTLYTYSGLEKFLKKEGKKLRHARTAHFEIFNFPKFGEHFGIQSV